MEDDGTWRIGTQADVAWINDGTTPGLTITAGIPPVFDGYATVLIPEDGVQRSDTALLALLAARSSRPWWLGYLDTGVHDVVFPNARRVVLYSGWHYVLVEAGPEQAATWRYADLGHSRLPDLIFPADRTWLVSMLWDDDWRCLGGPATLIDAVLAHPDLDARRVSVDEVATPPGFTAI